MAAKGLYTHARSADRSFRWMVAGYILVFELLGGLVLTLILPLFGSPHILLADPVGYFARFGIPVGLVAFALFRWQYASHAKNVASALGVAEASRFAHSRLIRIGEEQCALQGIRRPRFGVIDAPQLNALAVGEGPDKGLIAVTTGLLEHLDDDELAAIVAHECAHIRNGDTKVLAANHAMMRTAVLLQVNNALRFEDWRQLIVPLILPALLPIMLLSGFITMQAMMLAREVRRGINVSRDFVADAAAVRATHFPDALISAMHKVSGNGRFAHAELFEDILFEGREAGDGGSHPDMSERIAALHRHAGAMIDLTRVRRDSRSAPARPAPGGFGRRGLDPSAVLAQRSGGIVVPRVPPAPAPKPPAKLNQNESLRLMFSDIDAYRRHMAEITAYYEWRETDGRNWFGIKSDLRIPVIALTAFLLIFHFPSDGNLYSYAYKFSPQSYADLGVKLSQPFCYRSGSGEQPC